MKKIISTAKAPAAIGPYNQAILINGILYTSGQIPIDPISGKITVTDIASQTKQVLSNLKNILEEAGFSLPDVVKTTVFLTDMGNFGIFNEVYKTYFPKDPPARSCVAVKQLPINALVEIECIACK
jgi:2-iminobutanoate/2-iminopropanoate deaminase